MPTLNRIGKNAVVRHHRDVPLRLLESAPGLSCDAGDCGGNPIAPGHNLHALKAQLLRHAGRAKCLWLDPPRNTGSRAVHLLCNGILEDKSVGGGDVSTGPAIDVLSPCDGPKVIDAAANRPGTRTVGEGIVFNQTPHALGI